MTLSHPAIRYQTIRDRILQGAPRDALRAYVQIRLQGIYIFDVIPTILKACASLSLLNQGKSLHAESIKTGCDCDITLGTSIISMYAKCGEISDARKLFDIMSERNAVTWNAMIGGYLTNQDTLSALSLFRSMSERTPATWNQIIDGVAKTGNLSMARGLFDNVPFELRNIVTWTVMIDGYARNGDMEAARYLFEKMPERNNFVWSSMITGYCRRGDAKEAKNIFARIPVPNMVNWNCLLSGFVRNGHFEEAIVLFNQMHYEGFEPDEVTITSVLSACAQLGSLDVGKRIHLMVNEKGIKLNQFVQNGLVDMYIKCGEMDSAIRIFEEMSHRNTTCWNTMISGFSISGRCHEAVGIFHQLEGSGVKPDFISFLAVLSACAHGGFVEEGLKIFSTMEKYGLTPGIQHYSCLIDLLGRAGRLKAAFDVIKCMPIKANDIIFGSILGACRIHSESTIAEEVLNHISNIGGTDNESHYVLLSNIYAASDRWEKAEKIRMTMIDMGLRKPTGHSSIACIFQ